MQGVTLFLGRTSADICPVTAMISYLEKCGTAAGLLFKYEDGCSLMRGRFVEMVRDRLRKAGVDDCSHSFMIDTATAAAKAGIKDSIIETLGWWESVVYLQYVKILVPISKLHRKTHAGVGHNSHDSSNMFMYNFDLRYYGELEMGIAAINN